MKSTKLALPLRQIDARAALLHGVLVGVGIGLAEGVDEAQRIEEGVAEVRIPAGEWTRQGVLAITNPVADRRIGLQHGVAGTITADPCAHGRAGLTAEPQELVELAAQPVHLPPALAQPIAEAAQRLEHIAGQAGADVAARAPQERLAQRVQEVTAMVMEAAAFGAGEKALGRAGCRR